VGEKKSRRLKPFQRGNLFFIAGPVEANPPLHAIVRPAAAIAEFLRKILRLILFVFIFYEISNVFYAYGHCDHAEREEQSNF
jgi:hypothetical protein